MTVETTIARRALIVAAGCCVLTLHPACARADAGIPMISCVYPGFWLLLPLVIVLEAVIALVVFRRGVWVAVKVAAIANVASTLVGVPLRCLLVWVLSAPADRMDAMLDAGDVHAAWRAASSVQKIAVSILSAPVGGGWDPAGWELRVRLTWGLLLMPFLILSVLTEWWVARRVLPKDRRRLAMRWSLLANAASYCAIFAVFWWLFGWTWWWLDRR